MAVSYLGGLEIAAATVYCPPKGPTFPKAREASEELLAPITEQLVYGRAGPRAILGDFNCPSGSLDAMQHWISQGWIELQQLQLQQHGIAPAFTCKGVTSPDQLWISPELVKFVVNSAVWSIFPDHAVLIAGLRLPSVRTHEPQWHLPGHIPWQNVDFDLWHNSPEIEPWIQTSFSREGCEIVEDSSRDAIADASQKFHRWSQSFEQRATSCLSSATSRADRSFHGRASLCKPVLRRVNPVVPKSARPGEAKQLNGFLNRAVSRWYKQYRRLQSYHHAIASSRVSENEVSRVQLWQSIRRAHGFAGGFCQWWKSRPHPMQGSPVEVPLGPPSLQVATLMLEDFSHNYRRFELWQHERRLASCKAKLQATAKGIFSITRKPAKPPLDVLEDVVSQPIKVIDGGLGIVSVPSPFPTSQVHNWTLQNEPACVSKDGENYKVESDLLLVDGQSLSCKVTVTESSAIHQRLSDLWSPRWQKHGLVPTSEWNSIVDFAKASLPHGSIDLPEISTADFRQAVHRFKVSAATGPCGWTREDLLNLTDTQVSHVLDFFSEIENTGVWPTQLTVGLIHCLQKKPNAVTADGFRPITVCSLLYRLYAGIRAGQMLAHLSQTASYMQCGFLKQRQAADVWFFVGACIEVSIQSDSPVHGCVADLVKAYNTLPRFPVFKALEVIGFPPWMLRLWSNYLDRFTRYFVVNRVCGPGILSTTGYPEGCPLSCVAMTIIDHLWHRWQAYHSPRAMPISYVDNFELLSDNVEALDLGLSEFRRFCHCLDVSIDATALYFWSSSSAGRHELKARGYPVSYEGRDLGGQVVYCAKRRNKILTSRIASTFEWFANLRHSKQPSSLKQFNVKQVLFPRALHGCAAVPLGLSHFQTLRSKVMQSLKWDRAGASPLARLSLCRTDLDPEWYQLWQCLKTFQTQCRSNPAVLEWWSIYLDFRTQQVSQGPFGKLYALLVNIGITLDREARLWFSAAGYINLLLAPDALLREVVQPAYQNMQALHLSRRSGYHDLRGCDVKLTLSSDSTRTPAEQEQLSIVRDGSFISDNFKAKFDVRRPSVCELCGVLNSIEHKYAKCPHYSEVRQQHQAIMQQWEGLPESFRVHGLVPANPWQTLVWEAFLALDDHLEEFQIDPPQQTLHVFTDGTCTMPASPADALAAWAFRLQGYGTVACGPLKGIQQCILRAEMTAVLSSLKWCARHQGSLHIWCDNQTVIDHIRSLQAGTAEVESFEHQDIWQQISVALTATTAAVYIHKVPSHDQEEFCTSPFEDWLREGNGLADFQAALANHQRPAWFNRVWTGYQEFRARWKHLVSLLTAFHVAIAEQDVRPLEASPEDDVAEGSNEAFSLPNFEYAPNLGQTAAQFRVMPDLHTSFLPAHDHIFQRLCVQLCRWIIEQDEGAIQMRQVSLLELYVSFRVTIPGKLPLLTAGEVQSHFRVITFASDFSFFKRILRHLYRQAALPWTSDTVNLSFIHVLHPQLSLLLGWPSDIEQSALSLLRDFIGHRPITSAQALAKPWQP